MGFWENIANESWIKPIQFVPFLQRIQTLHWMDSSSPCFPCLYIHRRCQEYVWGQITTCRIAKDVFFSIPLFTYSLFLIHIWCKYFKKIFILNNQHFYLYIANTSLIIWDIPKQFKDLWQQPIVAKPSSAGAQDSAHLFSCTFIFTFLERNA